MSQIETIMLVALGFAIAALIALFLSRFFWAVALRLGNKRLLRSTPTTIAELRADRDRLRAEYAMLSRKLQLKMDNIKTSLAEQMAEVTRNRNRIDHLIAEVRTRDAMLAEREGEIARLTGHIGPLEAELANRTQSIQSSREQLRGREVELARRHKAVEQFRAELAERDRRIEAMRNEAVGKDMTYTLATNEALSAQGRLRKRIQDLTSLSSQIEAQRQHLAQQRSEFESLRSELAMATAEPERLDVDGGPERQVPFDAISPEPSSGLWEPSSDGEPRGRAPFDLGPPEPEFAPVEPEFLPSDPEFVRVEPEFLPPRREHGHSEQAYPEQAYSEQAYSEQAYPEQAYPEQAYSEQAMAEELPGPTPRPVIMAAADPDFAVPAAEDRFTPATLPDEWAAAQVVEAQFVAPDRETRDPDAELRDLDRGFSAPITELKIDNGDQQVQDSPKQPEGDKASGPPRGKLRAVTNVISLAARIRALQKTAGE